MPINELIAHGVEPFANSQLRQQRLQMNQLAMDQNRDETRRANMLEQAIPSAVAGDQNALNTVLRADPKTGMALRGQNAEMQAEVQKQVKHAALVLKTLPEEERGQAYGYLVPAMKRKYGQLLQEIPDHYDPNAWRRFELESGLARLTPEQAGQLLQAEMGIKHEQKPTSVQEYEYAKDDPGFAKHLKDQKTAVQQFKIENPQVDPNAVDPEDLEANAQAIARGQLPPITGFGSRSPRAAKIMARVLQINPEYRGSDYGSHAAGEKYFTSGKGGQTTRSITVAKAHLNTLGGLINALDNGNIQMVNKFANAYAAQTGKTAPTSFDAAKRIVADEIVKAIVGAGGALADREEASKSISSAQSPEQLRDVIKTYIELMDGQLQGLEQQYEQATGRKDYRARFGQGHEAPKPEQSAPPPTNAKGWTLHIDGQGNKAYVGPNDEIEELD